MPPLPDQRSVSPPGLAPGAGWAGAVLLAGLILIALAVFFEKKHAEADAQKAFSSVCEGIAAKIKVRLDSHEQILRSGAAFFNQQQVTREEWRNFYERQKMSQHLPGIQGLGFALLVPGPQLAAHVQTIRAEGFPAYRVWPEGERATYSTILFLEPFVRRNLRAFGYDMLTEPVRRAAMERARDQDAAVLSGKVTLVQETAQDVQAGLLMYVPVYRMSLPRATVAERRAALLGWVYSPYRMNDLMGGILGASDTPETPPVRLQIFAGATRDPKTLLYDNQAPNRPQAESAAGFVTQKIMEASDSRWLLVFSASSRPDLTVDYDKVWLVAIGGATITLLLAGLVFSLVGTQHKARKIAQRLTADLQESEERWKFALEGAGDGAWDWNLATGTVFFSRRWKEMLGYADHEIGTDLAEWRQRVHPEDISQVMIDVQQHLNGQSSSYVNEHRVRCKDGRWCWVLDRGKVMSWGPAGQPVRMIGTHTDITPRKLTEARLKESEALFHHLADSAPILIWMSGLDKGCFYFNKGWLAFTGRSQAQEQGNGWAEGVHPDDLARCLKVYVDHFDARRSFYMEYRLRHVDGVFHWVADTGVPRFDEQGVFLGFIGHCIDITANKQAEKSLRESEAHYRTLFEKATVGISSVASDSKLVGINESFARMHGYTVAEMKDLSFDDLDVPATSLLRRERLARILAGETLQFEAEHYHRDGHVISLEVSANLIPSGDRQVIQAVHIDITARKQVEALVQASLQEKEALLKEVHHRVKNNLQVIASLLRLEAGRSGQPDTKAVLKEMQGRIRSMALLHETLYRSGVFATIDLGAYLGQISTQSFRTLGSTSGAVQLRLELAPVAVEMDQALPCGLLVNELVSNCFKHGFPDGRTGEVRVELQPVPGGPQWRLRVSDTGVGLPADFADRRDQSLGLQLVSDLAEQIEGTLTVGPGPEAVFTVTFLPLHLSATPGLKLAPARP